MYFDVSTGKIKTLKLFISISSNLVILLILMPILQILHFPGPEIFCSKIASKVLDFSKNKNLKMSIVAYGQNSLLLHLLRILM